jgi:hypothetical protein
MKTSMKTTTAQRKSLVATTKTIAGHTVYSIAYGHIVWLRDTRKNKVVTSGKEDDFSMAEVCFAFTQDPLVLQGITGAKATKLVNDLLLSSAINTLEDLFNHAAEQLVIYAKTLSTPKKSPAAASRKPAVRPRKRS